MVTRVRKCQPTSRLNKHTSPSEHPPEHRHRSFQKNVQRLCFACSSDLLGGSVFQTPVCCVSPNFRFPTSKIAVRGHQTPLLDSMKPHHSQHKKQPRVLIFTLRKKYRTASDPYRATSAFGSMTFPRDLPILSPSLVRKPWPKTPLGRGSPADMSMPGQYTAWKRRMSCRENQVKGGQQTRPEQEVLHRKQMKGGQVNLARTKCPAQRTGERGSSKPGPKKMSCTENR
jgi:hypothetical protein